MIYDTQRDGYVAAPNQYVDVPGRRLAYRSVGSGKPIVLCTRFRGNLDLWDPLFIDTLAAQGFQVITFDYSGLGLSTGERSYHVGALARDAQDLVEALGLDDIVIGGWSIGGIAAQVALATFPERISHAVLIGTTPPGMLVKPAEQLFYDRARKPVNDLDDVITLFFEPMSEESRAAAERSMDRIARRTSGLSQDIPADWAAAQIGDRPQNPVFPSEDVLAFLRSTTTPILHIGGDHDIIFPIENWYALNEELPTLHLLTYPRAGHGPQHQHPQASAAHIATFVRATGHPPKA